MLMRRVFQGTNGEPPIALLVLIAVVFIAAISAEQRAEAARAREDLGLTRGSILDRSGAVIARTVSDGGRATREYSLPDSADVLGYRDPRGRWHGLEQRYDALLSAQHARADWRTFFQHLSGSSDVGADLELTIDRHLQTVAARALGAHPGAIVALDPRTGAVLAMASNPQCAPAQLSQAAAARRCTQKRADPAHNPATTQVFAPGSTFKIVTLSAALDTGRFHLGDVFAGSDIFGPSPYFDNSTYPSNITRGDLTALTLEQALAFSDNFTFAHVGLTLGGPTLLRYAHRFFIGRSFPFELPLVVSRVADGNPRPSAGQVARSSFGAPDDRVTPLQMAMIASAVANHGILMTPYLVRAVVSPNGRMLQQVRPRKLDRVMTAAAARAVTDGMLFVVQHGSGFKAQIGGVAVAGKTGTAAGRGAKPDAWFIAFAPARHPVIAVAVLREDSGEGFQYAAPIARRALVAALREHGFRVH
jgi:peptidoglycan glycosyltransferase